MALGSIRDIYSQGTLEEEKKLKEVEAAKPGAYESNYGGVITDLLDKIVNQKDFSYDFNADPLYQQYKDTYTQIGKQASMDAAANVSALTGGFGNSYAATAATQANQQYLQQMNNVIPELYQLAMDKYQMDTDRLYSQYSAVGNQEDREYGKYRDTVGDWKDERSYQYGRYMDSVSNDQYVSGYNQSERLAAQAAASEAAKANNNGTTSPYTAGYSQSTGYGSAMTAAIEEAYRSNTDSAFDKLASYVDSGAITEQEALEIITTIEKNPKTYIKNMAKYLN